MEGMVSFKHSTLVSLAVMLIIVAASAGYSVATQEGEVIREVVADINNNQNMVIQEIVGPSSNDVPCVPLLNARCRMSYSAPQPCCKGKCGGADGNKWKCFTIGFDKNPTCEQYCLE